MEGRRLTGPLAWRSEAEKSNSTMPWSTVTVTASLIGRSTATPSLSSRPCADADAPVGSPAIAARSPSAAAFKMAAKAAHSVSAPNRVHN
jgi:hypothetical protein